MTGKWLQYMAALTYLEGDEHWPKSLCIIDDNLFSPPPPPNLQTCPNHWPLFQPAISSVLFSVLYRNLVYCRIICGDGYQWALLVTMHYFWWAIFSKTLPHHPDSCMTTDSLPHVLSRSIFVKQRCASIVLTSHIA